MSRQAQGTKDRVPFFCYIDEFQHFITPSMASILSGARKYGLGLVLSHQDMNQVSKYDTEIAGSVLANAGTRICFRLGDTDAKRLEDGFSAFSADDLQNLPTGEAIARVNTRDADFNLTVIPYSEAGTAFIEEIIKSSRDTYSVPVAAQPSSSPEAEPASTRPQATVQKDASVAAPIAGEPPIAKPEQIREHRYLQTFVKALAESHGYKASIEIPTPDGTGLVDVLLEKGTETIAVEISVTTTPEWELHNIRKCLAAGYGRIVVCAADTAKLKLIKHQITGNLTTAEQTKIQVIASSDLPIIFETSTDSEPAEIRVKGYRVKVNYESNPNRQDLLQSIIKAARKP